MRKYNRDTLDDSGDRKLHSEPYLSKIMKKRGVEIPSYVGSGAMALGALALYPESPEYIFMGIASILCLGAGIGIGQWSRKSGFNKKL